ncbi:hypothetical protein GBAR_LOCUS7959 [Geodia barretti]|uniref:DinB-like domain-containing protein n=1 Tax=Geodia barretti TaxID=519541 RepID=A0AA35RJV4_GEOBA|nr:hypothetical protein GBAR_LOCUS7959 [Geodia barretti]
MEEFLTSNGVQYEHHDIASEPAAQQFLESKGVKSAPVTVIDDEIIIGYFPRKLIATLKLDTQVDLSGRTGWLADKYDKILHATIRATMQLSPDQLESDVAWRPETLRDTIVHIMSFPELAYLSHKTGSMTTDDMQACRQRLASVNSSEEIAEYAEGVIANIVEFLNSGDNESFDRVVPAHYGGEVSVVELLNIILSHSTHHLKQVYWFMETSLGITPQDRATAEDMEGIFTPEALI